MTESNTQWRTKLMRACWLCKTVISSRLDSEQTLPAWTRKHIDECDKCRRFYETESQLIERLVESASDPREETSPFLRAKIMAAVRREEPSPLRPSLRLSWAAGVAVALVLVSVLSIQVLQNFKNTSGTSDVARRNLVDPDGPLAPVLTLASREKLFELSRNLDQPLEAELQFVVSDARAAIQTLAYNFLPEGCMTLK